MNEIKLGEMTMIKTEDLCFALGNRETYDAHINKFESLLSDYGFLDALKVIPSDDCFLIVEGQHRFEAGKRLGMKEFPCYIIDWLEGCDEDEIQNIIISLNANNKTWTIYDYVKSFADRGDEGYKTLKSRMIQYRETLSNGVVAACHSGAIRGHSTIKEGNFKNANNEFSEWILNKLHQVIISDGKKNFPSRTLSIFVANVWKDREDLKFVHLMIQEMRKHIAFGQPLPDGDQAFAEWYDKIVILIRE